MFHYSLCCFMTHHSLVASSQEVAPLHTYVFPCCSFEVLFKVIEHLEPILSAARNAFSFYYINLKSSTVRQKTLHVNSAAFVWWVLARRRKAEMLNK